MGEWGRKVDAIEAPFAPRYDAEEYNNPGLQALNLAEMGMLAEAFGTRPPWMGDVTGAELAGKRMLEVGCGTGRIALYGASLGAQVTALDQTAEYVEATADKVNRLPQGTPEPILIVAPAESLDPTQKSDYVTAMFGVLNHCEDWSEVLKDLSSTLNEDGKLVLSMYGSPDAAVYEEIKNGLPYAPAILTRRTPGGILLGEETSEVLPASFPYPADVLDKIEEKGLEVQRVQPFLAVTALYPRDFSPKNVAAFLDTVERRYGVGISGPMRKYASTPEQLLLASLRADYQVPKERINEAAYFGVIATKRRGQ